MSKRFLRQHSDTWIVLGLCAVAILTRIPFRSQILYHWDSVNFALALDEFDIRLNQPHLPATLVIYILLGRALNAFLHDPNLSLVWISILSTALGASALYALGTRWFDRGVGLASAVLMLSSPLVWLHGEVALTYMLEFAWVVLVILACSALHTGDPRPLLLSALLLGMSGGIRPNTPVFLFPLWLFAARKHKLGRISLALAVMGIGVLLWAIPLVVMAGGLEEYLRLALGWARELTGGSGTVFSILERTGRFATFATYCVGAGALPLLWAAWRHRRAWVRSLRTDRRAQLLALWILPAAAFLVFVHLMQAGHTFTIMPAIIILMSLAIASVRRATAQGQRNWTALLALTVLCNGLFFLIGPASLFGSTRITFIPPTRAAIHEHDSDIAERLDVIRATFRPEETVVLAAGRNYRLPDFYLAEFQMSSLSHELGDDVDSIVLPENIHVLVLFDDAVMPQLSSAPGLRTLRVGEEGRLRYITWNQDQLVTLSEDALVIEER
jgi:hypothetical protein